MPRLGRGGRQLGSPLWKASVENEVDAEFEFHVEMRTREYIARGMDPAAARAAAIAKFGDIAGVNAECRNIGNQRERKMVTTEYLGELAHDVRFTLRQLLKAPGFTIVAVITLALGVGATTAIFSAVESVVLRPFPYPRPDELVFAFTHWKFGDGGVSVGDYAEWQRRSKSLAQLGAFQFKGVTIAADGSPDRVTAAYATANVFSLYGVNPQLGRVFTTEEDQPGHDGVVVLSDGFWRRNFAASAHIVGRTMTMNGRPVTILGVMPASFDPTDSHEDLWAPIAFTPAQLVFHDEHYLTVVGRLKPGVAIGSAQREMDVVAKQLSAEFPATNKVSGIHLQDFSQAVIGDYRARLLVLLGAVMCVLLIACGNVANLLLARGAARSKELAIRTAIGAGRGRIVRQLLTESLVLALLATIVGLALAWLGIHVLIGAAPASIPRLAATRLDGVALLFALALAVFSAIVFGLVPAVRAARGDLQGALREGGRSAVASARDRVRAVLVIAEVSIALTLLVGAGLLIRSAIFLNHVNPGFDVRGLLSTRVALRPASDSASAATEAEQVFMRLATELRARPGVEAAAITSSAPLGGGGGSNGIVPEGKEQSIANAIDARLRMVSPGYISMMRIPILRGRDINDQDARGNVRVMVVSEALAKAAWPNQDPIGKRVSCCEGSPDDPRWKTIVGVAADVHTGGPTQEIRPEFYIPIAQAPPDAWRWINRTMTVVVRATSGDAVSLTPTVRAAVKSIDPSLPVYSIATMSDRLTQSLAESRFHLELLVALGGVGLLLAAAGIYSVIAYFVTLRRHEIGVRMALGATTGDVVRLMTWQGLRPVFVGAVLGVIAATWATRLLRGSLYGVTANDPVTFAAVTLVLVIVSFAAILVPARRVASVEPTTALHG
jgi:putative ABC transport system permease protein